MRATPIPDSEIWPGAVRKVYAAAGRGDIAPCEALVDRAPKSGHVNISVRCELEAGELEQLQAGGVVWLTFWGAMVPWAAVVAAPAERADDSRCETWVSIDDHGAERFAHIEYDARGVAQVSHEAMTDLLTRAGLRLRLDADPL